MSAQPIAAEPRPLRILPIPDHAAPVVPLDEAETTRRDERQLAIGLELLHTARPTPPTYRVDRVPSVAAGPVIRYPNVLPDDEDLERPLERPTGLAELQLWVAKLVPALLEVAAGTRPAPQLMRWVSPAVYEGLLRRHARAVRRGSAVRRPLRVVRVVLREPAHAVVEASVVFADGRRVRAAALRFVPVDRRWVADAFEVG